MLTCAIGRRSAQAAGIMLAAGYDKATHLRDGMLSWEGAGFETVSDEPAKEFAGAEIAVLPGASA